MRRECGPREREGERELVPSAAAEQWSRLPSEWEHQPAAGGPLDRRTALSWLPAKKK